MRSPFAWMYERVMQWPPDVMLAPMTLANPDRWWRLALLTTVASVLGGLLGYCIGYFGIDAVTPYLEKWGYIDSLERARSWFAEYGFWAIFIAGFSPIPYKVFTIAAGAVGMLLPLFVFASLVGRGARYLLVAGLVRAGGPKLEQNLRKHVDRLGIAATILIVILIWFINRH